MPHILGKNNQSSTEDMNILQTAAQMQSQHQQIQQLFIDSVKDNMSHLLAAAYLDGLQQARMGAIQQAKVRVKANKGFDEITEEELQAEVNKISSGINLNIPLPFLADIAIAGAKTLLAKLNQG